MKFLNKIYSFSNKNCIWAKVHFKDHSKVLRKICLKSKIKLIALQNSKNYALQKHG